MDPNAAGSGGPPSGSGGAPLDLSRMTVAQRIKAMETGEIPVTGLYRVLEPDAVQAPHVAGHPIGMINRRDPTNSDNMFYKSHAPTDSSVEAGHQFVDMFHAISQPNLGDTARIVPNSMLARQTRMRADLQGDNPTGRLLDPRGIGKGDSRLRDRRHNRDRFRGGRGGRLLNNRRDRPAPTNNNGDKDKDKAETENEQKRRDEVIAAAEKHRKGARDNLLARYNDGRLATHCAKLVLSSKSVGKYPLLSAAYQHWLEDEQAWMAVFGTRDGFTWAKPNIFGAPYSRVYLEAFYEETEEEKEKRRQDQLRCAAAFASAMPAQAEGAGSEDATGAGGGMETPAQWYDNGVLVAVEHSSIDERRNVWKRLFGTNEWFEGCRPFEVPVPGHMDPQVVLAAPDDLAELMFKLWARFSPAYPWCVRVFARCRRDPEARFGVRMWVYLDWPASQDLANISWLRHMYYAALRLLTWYHKLLRGEQVHIMAEVDSQKEWEFQQHRTLFDNLKVRLDAIAQRNEADEIEGDKATTRELRRKQQVTVSAIALKNVESRMRSTDDPDKQLGLLIEVIEKGLKPLPLSLDDRRLAVTGAAKTVLATFLRAMLGSADDVRAKVTNINLLMNDVTDTWGKVLPIGSRFQVIRDTIRHHEPLDHRKILEEYLETWTSIKDVCEYVSEIDIDPLTERARQPRISY